jgi:hypothetical protein
MANRTDQISDSNFCVPCDDVREFFAGKDSRLFCITCGWSLDEGAAVAAAESWESDQLLVLETSAKMREEVRP